MSTTILEPPIDALDSSVIRKDFPILQQSVHGRPLIYFDNAATTQKPRAVTAALTRYYERDNSNVHRGIHELSNRATTAYEAARQRAAQFIGARHTREIVFTRGTTESINLVAQAWGTKHVKRGDKILLTEMEHHSNMVPWQMLAQRVGAKLSYVPVNGDEGLLDLSEVDRLLAGGVKIFAMTHVSNTLGTINPVKELCAWARELGVTTLVDAAQSARCAGNRMRFSRLLRTQDVWPDGHRRALRPGRKARADAAISRRGRNDLERQFF